MKLDDYNLPESPINVVVDDILALLSEAKDLGGNKLLYSAVRGIDEVMRSVISAESPSPDELPCVRIFGGHHDYPIKSNDFITYEINSKISIYVILYGRDVDNFESRRERFIDRLIRHLEAPTDDSEIGFEPNKSVWGFPNEEFTITRDHDTPLRYLGRDIKISSGYFVSRIDIPIEAVNLPINYTLL